MKVALDSAARCLSYANEIKMHYNGSRGSGRGCGRGRKSAHECINKWKVRERDREREGGRESGEAGAADIAGLHTSLNGALESMRRAKVADLKRVTHTDTHTHNSTRTLIAPP